MKVRVQDIVDRKVDAACLDCREHIAAWDDDVDGIWLECGCDAGYARGDFILCDLF